jgi:site-specific DNA recombinase
LGFQRKLLHKKSVVWRCVNRLEEKGSDCPSQTIAEEVLQTGVIKAINRIITGREGFITILSKNIETVLGAEFDMDTDEIDAKLGTLQDEVMQLASSKSDYDNLAAEIHRLRSIKQDTQEHNALRQTKRQRISEMTEFLCCCGNRYDLYLYDDKLTRQLIEKITVFEDKLQVDFKSGVEIEVEI